jgi:CSLREA domain-containing protein
MKGTTMRKTAVAICGAFAGAALFAGTASAADIPVSVTTDDITVNGNCTLREAVQAARTNTAVDACQQGSVDEDRISLTNTGTYTLTLQDDGTPDDNQGGDLDLAGAVEIEGASGRPTIAQASSARVLHVTSGSLQLLSARIFGGDGGNGGGVWVQAGDLLAISVTFEQNRGVNGGAIMADGAVYVEQSRFIGNYAETGDGGAMELGSAPNHYVLRSSFEGNTAPGSGGAIDVWNGGAVTIANSTFTSNAAQAGSAVNVALGADGASLLNDTIVGNSATSAGGGALKTANTADLTVARTIVATNLDPIGERNCASAVAGDAAGAHNLVSTADCGLVADATTGNLTSTNPQLSGAPELYGGNTAVLPPFADSPAVDAVPIAQCSLPNPDQHGTIRPVGGACDIGAYEGSIGKVPADVVPRGADPRCAALRKQLKKAKRKEQAKKVKKIRKKLRRLGC